VTGEGRHPSNDHDIDPDAGVMLRPEMVILGDEVLVPRDNVVRPPPNRFTHELVVDEPYRFDRPEQTPRPDGVLPAGTRVVLLVEGDDRCRVVDGAGRYVQVRRDSLRELPGDPSP
jgi:hypothetical protein